MTLSDLFGLSAGSGLRAIASGTRSEGCSDRSAARSTRTDRSQCDRFSLADCRSVTTQRHTATTLATETMPRTTTARVAVSTYAETFGGVAE